MAKVMTISQFLASPKTGHYTKTNEQLPTAVTFVSESEFNPQPVLVAR
jgi:hypothetical protein